VTNIYEGREEFYQHPQVTLTVKECKKLQVRCKNAFGDAWPYKGHYHPLIGPIRYNGGCTRDDEWWPGEVGSVPIVPKGWEVRHIPTWGYHVQKTDEDIWGDKK